jgi:CTP synthase
MAKQTKFIFVTGGVVSSLGKGITSASLGRLLKSRGLKVSSLKFDPYLNVDPGTMSPYQHGEVFVTDDGCETDLDLGHYERFIDENLTSLSNVTAGQIYWSIVTKERRGDFLGETVQVIPHVTNEIKDSILKIAEQNQADVIITEVGGTVGDIESLPFLEAIRQFRKDVGRQNVLYVHITLIPYLRGPAELKTKPTQHSVNELRRIGIQPDILICRCDRPLEDALKKKIALFCDTEPQAVISAVDTPNVYEVPLVLHQERLDAIVCSHLQLKCHSAELTDWRKLIDQIEKIKYKVRIAVVGKYIQVPDAYISIKEALKHGGFYHQTDVEVHWVDAETLEPQEVEKELAEADGVLIPGGFGIRGIEGKINAITYARKNKLPFLGICLGMQ